MYLLKIMDKANVCISDLHELKKRVLQKLYQLTYIFYRQLAGCKQTLSGLE